MLNNLKTISLISNNIINNTLSKEEIPRSINELIQIVKKHTFLYTYVRDLIINLEKLESNNFDEQVNLLKTLNKRLNYFHHWNQSKNGTIKLIEDKIIHPNDIKPHIRYSDIEYENYYSQQNIEVGERLKTHKKTPFNRFKPHDDLVFRKNYDHMIRKSQAINVIETYMAILESLDININRKWLDIGCGNGLIANAVNPKRHSKNHWQIHGCDLQQNKIQVAKNKACKGRYFYQENVLDKLKNNNVNEKEFDIISMFEFCEHFADPFSLLQDISQNNFKIMIIATPLEQKLNKVNDSVPDPVHLWSFSAKAIIEILEHLNLKIIYHSETSVGKYTQGLDWLTVVAVKAKVYTLFQT